MKATADLATRVPEIPHGLSSRPLIFGHRGAPRVATENTLAAFAAAVSAGADGVELDVRRSRDGTPVVIHDDALDRTMGVAGVVSKLRWPAIQRLAGARVPSLEQVVAWAAASGAWLNIELKSGGVEEEVLRLVSAADIRGRTVVSSFDPVPIRRMGELDGAIRRFFLTERWNAEARAGLESADAHGVCLHVDAASSVTLRDLSDHGLPVIVWTVNEPNTMRRLFEEGAAAVITDLPELAERIRREKLGGSPPA